MKIAVLSDIHGFSLALEAVLADIDRRGVDRIVVAGDLCEGGPGPEDVIDLLRERDVSSVYGNTDRDLIDGASAGGAMAAWARDRIGQSGLDYLESLPFSIRVPHPRAGEDPATDLLVVHANPTDVDRHLSPNASDRELLEIIGAEPASTIAFGHLHVAYVRRVESKTLVDVSAVGNPRDGDLRPRYVVFSERDDLRWDHAYHYVDYPVQTTREHMERSGMPGWERAFDRLMSARYNRPI